MERAVEWLEADVKTEERFAEKAMNRGWDGRYLRFGKAGFPASCICARSNGQRRSVRCVSLGAAEHN